MGEPCPFFVSEFTLVLELFVQYFADFNLIWEMGGKVGGPPPVLVSKFISILELFAQNFVIVHAFL